MPLSRFQNSFLNYKKNWCSLVSYHFVPTHPHFFPFFSVNKQPKLASLKSDVSLVWFREAPKSLVTYPRLFEILNLFIFFSSSSESPWLPISYSPSAVQKTQQHFLRITASNLSLKASSRQIPLPSKFVLVIPRCHFAGSEPVSWIDWRTPLSSLRD